MLALVNSLLDDWHSNNLLYCHWKSNDAIARGLNGEGDLDILVSQTHIEKAYGTLIKLGFKRLTERPYKAYPGIEHWLGLSKKEGVFVHVHLHFRLVYGEKFIKAHRYGNESSLLERRVFKDGIYQVKREDELIFLFIRSILKVDFIWVIKKIIGKEKSYLPQLIFKEYQFLLSEISEEELAKSKDAFMPFVDFDSVFAAIKHIETLSLLKLLVWRYKILRALSMSRRLSWLSHIGAFLRVYSGFALVKLGAFKKPKKQVFTGGVTIALLGADGAGKSTMLRELNGWIGRYLDVETLYVGSGDGNKSLTLTLFDYLNSLRKKHNKPTNLTTPESSDKASTIKIVLRNIRAVLVARHRLKTVSRGLLHSNNGKIVLYDRYPQPFNRGYSDGPKVIDNGGWVTGWLYRWEMAIYNELFAHFPDHCLCLLVDPAVSVERKGEDSEDVINNKNNVIEELLKVKSSKCSVIDANQGFDAVLLELKDLVWKNL